MGRITIDQSHQIMAVFATNVDWNTIDFEGLQDAVIRRPKDAGAAFAAWLKNACQLTIKKPSVLVIDRSKPFDPVKFIGTGWSVVEGDSSNSGLTEVDFSKVRFESGLIGDEKTIDGETKLQRLKAMPEIRPDAHVGQALFEEKGQMTLRWLHDTHGITWLELAGAVLRSSDGYRYFLCLDRSDDGSWSWNYYWLGFDCDRDDVSPLLAS